MNVKSERMDDRDLADALALVAVKLPRVLRALDEARMLTSTEASALAVLVYGGTMNIGELARHEQVKPPSMTRTVTKLEERKLVKRIRDERDGRGWVVEVTPAGRKLLNEGHVRRLRPLVVWLEKLEPERKKQLLGALPVLMAMSNLEMGRD